MGFFDRFRTKTPVVQNTRLPGEKIVPRMEPLDVSTRDSRVGLGVQARDKVTGFRGTVVAVVHDIDGSIQIAIQPKLEDPDGKEPPKAHDFDLERVELVPDAPEPILTNEGRDRPAILLGETYIDKATGFIGTATRLIDFLGGCSYVTLEALSKHPGAIEAVTQLRFPVERVEIRPTTQSETEQAPKPKVKATRTGGPSSLDSDWLDRGR